MRNVLGVLSGEVEYHKQAQRVRPSHLSAPKDWLAFSSARASQEANSTILRHQICRAPATTTADTSNPSQPLSSVRKDVLHQHLVKAIFAAYSFIFVALAKPQMFFFWWSS